MGALGAASLRVPVAQARLVVPAADPPDHLFEQIQRAILIADVGIVAKE